MLQETMRVCALVGLSYERELTRDELEELAFLTKVLERASRATANRPRLELEADAHMTPMPPEEM